MKTSLFDFDLPESLIAMHPASPRDAARMLVTGEGLQDKTIRDLPQFLKPGDVLVMNDTKVIPARLFGKRADAKVELLLHKALTSPSPLEGEGGMGGICLHTQASNILHHSPLPEMVKKQHPDVVFSTISPPPQGGREYWRCFAKPAKRLKPGDRIDFAEDFHATVVEKLPSGEVVLQFATAPSPCRGEGWGGGLQATSLPETPSLTLPPAGGGDFYAKLEKYGHMPLPPYIRRGDGAPDREQYQTIYATHEGSVAAPTAGLHFTPQLLAAIDAAGVTRAHVTLHVGGGTFLPVKADDTEDHIMHSEFATITPETAARINAAKKNGGRVIAVGTTSLRTLESAADANGQLAPFSGETNIFITPGYRFKIVDILLTNFHLPRSTLFMLVSAFAGLERMQSAYAHAIAENYRFYSYGDACLLFR